MDTSKNTKHLFNNAFCISLYYFINNWLANDIWGQEPTIMSYCECRRLTHSIRDLKILPVTTYSHPYPHNYIHKHEFAVSISSLPHHPCLPMCLQLLSVTIRCDILMENTHVPYIFNKLYLFCDDACCLFHQWEHQYHAQLASNY